MLLNWYKDGSDYMGPHSDDERQLVPKAAIYSFNFGARRDFVISGRKGRVANNFGSSHANNNSVESALMKRETSDTKPYRKVIPLENNSMLIMGGEMQKYYKHAVPKRKGVMGRRINVTFRLYK